MKISQKALSPPTETRPCLLPCHSVPGITTPLEGLPSYPVPIRMLPGLGVPSLLLNLHFLATPALRPVTGSFPGG